MNRQRLSDAEDKTNELHAEKCFIEKVSWEIVQKFFFFTSSQCEAEIYFFFKKSMLECRSVTIQTTHRNFVHNIHERICPLSLSCHLSPSWSSDTGSISTLPRPKWTILSLKKKRFLIQISFCAPNFFRFSVLFFIHRWQEKKDQRNKKLMLVWANLRQEVRYNTCTQFPGAHREASSTLLRYVWAVEDYYTQTHIWRLL